MGSVLEELRSPIEKANELIVRGRLAQARALLGPVVRDRRRLLGRDHPDTLNAVAALASAQTDPRQARILEEEVVERRRATVGDDDPATLQAMVNLAVTYLNLRKPGTAREILETALAGRVKLGGEESEAAVGTLSILGMALVEEGRLERARAVQEREVALRTRRGGSDDWATLNATERLGWTLAYLGETDQSQRLLAHVFERRLAGTGGRTMERWEEVRHRSLQLFQMGQREESVQLLSEMAAELRVELGSDHPATLMAESDLTLVRDHDLVDDPRDTYARSQHRRTGKRAPRKAGDPSNHQTIDELPRPGRRGRTSLAARESTHDPRGRRTTTPTVASVEEDRSPEA